MSRRRKTKPAVQPATGVAREVTWEKLLSLFDKTLHDKLEKWRQQDGIEAVVCFENIQTGERSALAVGPACTYQLEAALNGALAGKSGDAENGKIPIEYARCKSTTMEVPGSVGVGT